MTNEKENDTNSWMTPDDYKDPMWSPFTKGSVHEWKNYISKELQAMWGTFTDEQQQAIARSAEEAAGREHWE